jgi:hypothetical protein
MKEYAFFVVYFVALSISDCRLSNVRRKDE